MFESAKIKPAEKDSKVLGAVVYLCSIFGFMGFLIPVLIFVIAKDDKFARFHALQSLLYLACFFIVYAPVAVILWFTVVGICIVIPVYLLFVLSELYLAYLAWQGESCKIPLVGGLALGRLD